jgi:hypothetical protein
MTGRGKHFDQLLQGNGVHRLDDVMIESGLLRAASMLFIGSGYVMTER